MSEGGPPRGSSGADDQARRTPGGESVETALQLAIDLHGPGLLNRPEKLRLHLDAQCVGAASDIGFLMAALDEGVPQALLELKTAAQMHAVTARLQEMLAERRGLNPFAASWAVATWAAALRMDLFGPADPGGEADRDRPPPAGPEPVGSDPAQRVAAAPTTPFSVPFAHLRQTEPPSSVPVSEPLATRETVETDAHLTEPVTAAAAAREPAADAAVTTSSPAIEPTVVPDDAMRGRDGIVVTDGSAASVTAVPATEAVVVPPAGAPPPPAPTPVDEESLPRWAADTDLPPPTVPTRPRFAAAWGIAGLIAAIVVAIGAMRWMQTPGETLPAPPPAVAEAPAARESVPVVPSPVAPVSVAPSPVAPVSEVPSPVAPASVVPSPVSTAPVVPSPVAPPGPPSIVDVAVDGPLLGDGTRHAVFVTFDPTRRDVKSVEATFMAGDGAPEPRSIVVEVPATQDGRVAVGSIGLRTAKPAISTFQYVLVATDGQRSTPFVKQFAFVPVATRASAIDDIVVPSARVAGAPFTLTIHVRPGESGIASVERSTVGAAGPPRKTLLAGLARPNDGTLRYPVEALASTTPTTFAFTLIDEDGSRSEPKRIVVEPATTTRVADGATAPRPEPFACARATCGSVVSVREIDRSKTFEVLARMDDRTIRTLVASSAWKVGTRVRRVGNGFAPVQAVAAPTSAPRATTRRTAVPVLPESPPIVDR